MTGTQTRLALLAYQTAQGLPLTGSFDTATAGEAKKSRRPSLHSAGSANKTFYR